MEKYIFILFYLVVFIILFVLELFYFKIAEKFNIIDNPNLRSSHSKATIRGGGIIFPISVLLMPLISSFSLFIVIPILLVSIISFIDDIKPLSQINRLVVHFIAIGFICYYLLFMKDEYSTTIYIKYGNMILWLIPFIAVVFIGWINVFNFMDGINGITVFYSIVTLLSLLYTSIEPRIILILILACIVFAFFNARTKAMCFAGDVGSISMAFILGYFVLYNIFKDLQLAYILFFVVYGIDGGMTIFNRLRKGENIFKAHRSHLYQYLANEMEIPHVKVSFIYALAQAVINLLVIYFIENNLMTLPVIFIILILLTGIYYSIRIKVMNKIKHTRNESITNRNK